MLGPLRTCWGLSEYVGAYQNMLGLIRICWVLPEYASEKHYNLICSFPAQTCYGRLHGPKGYGFGGGAGTLNTDSGNQMDDAEKDKIQ